MSISDRIIYRADPDFERTGDILKFRLTYQGLLYSSSNGNRNAANKHHVRRQFHPQLKRLFDGSELFRHVLINQAPENKYLKPPPLQAPVFGLEDLANRGRMGNFRFVPLVKEEFSLWCGLEVLFLRPGRAGKIFKSGDIDNRIKTILDALKKPRDLQDIEADYPTDYEDPLFCLLEDDSLIAKLSVDTDDLLGIVGGQPPNDNDAHLIITVTLRPSIATWENMGFSAG